MRKFRTVRLGLLGLAALAADGRGQATVAEVAGAYAFVEGTGGRQLAGCGDVDGDGVGDLVAGAGADAAAGRVTVFSGADGAVRLERFGVLGEELGASVASAGDVDGDGFPDVVVGAPNADGAQVSCGRALVLSGKDFTVLRTFLGSDADGRHGTVVAGGCDLDEDGVPDPIAGGRDHMTAYDGKTGAVLHDLSPAPGNGLALRVAALGDYDGDGADDFAVARPNHWVRVHSGRTAAALLDLPATENAFWFGASVAAAGDLDGDGAGDLLVGATGCLEVCQTPGRVLVIGGVPHGVLLSVDGPSYESAFGASVALAGDVDQDGAPDYVVGAPSDGASGFDAGRVTVVSGASGEPRFSVLGDAAGRRLGSEVAGLGDVDGDGVSDVAAGRVSSEAAPGFARVLSGGRPDVALGRTLVGALDAQAGPPDVDEVHVVAVKETRLKLRATVTGGDLRPRVTVFGPDGAIVKVLDFPKKAKGKKTKGVKLTENGLYRLRVEGRKKGGVATAGGYRIETDAKFRKKAGEFTATRKGTPGELLAVKLDALPGATLDAAVVPKKGYARPPALQLRAPDGAVLGAAPYIALEDGVLLLTGVPLLQLGQYAIEAPAGTLGKSKLKVKVDLAQPTGAGDFAVP